MPAKVIQTKDKISDHKPLFLSFCIPDAKFIKTKKRSISKMTQEQWSTCNSKFHQEKFVTNPVNFSRITTRNRGISVIEKEYAEMTRAINKILKPHSRGRIAFDSHNKAHPAPKNQGVPPAIHNNFNQEKLDPDTIDSYLKHQFGNDIKEHKLYKTLFQAREDNDHVAIANMSKTLSKESWYSFLKSFDQHNIGKLFSVISKLDGRRCKYNIPQGFSPMYINGVLTIDSHAKANGIAKNLVEKHFTDNDWATKGIGYDAKLYLGLGGAMNNSCLNAISSSTEAEGHIGFQFKPINKSEVRYAINGMNPDGAPGPDMITLKIYKEFTSLDETYANLINGMLKFGYLPASLRRMYIIPLEKPNKDKSSINSIRPITLINTFAKIIEKIVYERIAPKARKEFVQNQYGFIPDASTETHLTDLLSSINRGNLRSRYTVVTSLDVEGAFDAVRHNILMNRLHEMKIPPYILKYIWHWLKDRSFQTEISLKD